MNGGDKRLNKGTILIVDDSPQDLLFLSELLTNQGFTIRSVPDGHQALQACEMNPPELILLDIIMPEMDGYEVCGRLKLDEKTKNIPVLFIRALNETTDKVRGFGAGGVDFITKPFEFEEILARINIHLSNFRTQVQFQATCDELRLLNTQLEERVLQRTEELEKANKALREIKAQFEAVYNHHYQLTGLMDTEGRLLMGNRTALEFAGIRAEDVAGKRFVDTPWWTHSKEAQDQLQDAIERALGGEFVRFETTHVSAAGETRDFAFCISPVFDDNGAVIYLVPEGYDVTERKAVEKSLRESEEMNRALVETSKDWIWSINLERIHTYCNPAVEAILGYNPNELVGNPSFDLIHEEERNRIESMLNECINHKRGWANILIRWKAKDGTYRFLESNAVPILNDKNELTGFRGVDRDITGRKNAEEALRESEEKYRTFFENFCDPMQMLHNERFIDCNAATLTALGYGNKEEFLNTHPWEISPEYQPDGNKSIDKAKEMIEIAYDTGTHRFEWDHKKLNGDVLPVEVSLTAIPSQGEMILHCIWRDISDRKRAEAERKELEFQFLQSQKMEAVGQLAGGVAHDFNNLLQAIIGYGELALAKTEQGSVLNRELNQMMKASGRAAALVRQLLAFSRKQVLKLETLDLNEIVEDLGKMIRRVIGEHIAFNILSEPGLKMIHADRGQLEQILMNLCVNARDAMPEGGKLTITTGNTQLDAVFCQDHAWAKPGNYVMLSVSDTGVGMDQETQRRIFEPFYTTKKEGKGTGLGLSTVYGIVRQHQGIIHVHSEINLGTTFRIYLPMSESSLKDEHDIEESEPAGGTEVILLAEDDELVRDLAQQILENAGYTVLTARDGEEAIRLFDLHTEEIGLALLDVIMPGCGGKAVFEHIRKTGEQTPVLFASGYTSSTVHTNFVLNQDMQFIQKPYKRNELLWKVRQVIDS